MLKTLLSKALKGNKSKKTIVVTILVAILGFAGLNVTQGDVSKYLNMVMPDDVSKELSQEASSVNIDPTNEPAPSSVTPSAKQDFNAASRITKQRAQHILYGDATGGGHLYGTGKPCKSEFPEHWDAQTVLKEVDLIAANDNLRWEQQRNGYYVTEQKVGTVNVRVVKGRNGQDVITAYPTNVARNACPSRNPANDNRR